MSYLEAFVVTDKNPVTYITEVITYIGLHYMYLNTQQKARYYAYINGNIACLCRSMTSTYVIIMLNSILRGGGGGGGEGVNFGMGV